MTAALPGDTKPPIPWRELSGFRNATVPGCLGVSLGAVWRVVERDLPALSAAVNRMTTHLGSHGCIDPPLGR